MVGFHPCHVEVLFTDRADPILTLVRPPALCLGERSDRQEPLVTVQDERIDASFLSDIVVDHQTLDFLLEFVERLSDDMADKDLPVEVRSLGRTLKRWKHQIAAWHTAPVSYTHLTLPTNREV